MCNYLSGLFNGKVEKLCVDFETLSSVIFDQLINRSSKIISTFACLDAVIYEQTNHFK